MPTPADQSTDDTTLDAADVAGAIAGAENDGAAGDQAADADGSASNDDSGGDAGDGGAQGAAGDELTIVLEGDEGAEPPEQQEDPQAPAWVRDLRKSNREKDRRIRELERKVQAVQPPQTAAVVVGPEPTFEDCGFDAVVYKQKLLEWNERAAAAKKAQDEATAAQEKQQKLWQDRVASIDSATTSLRIAGADEARESFENGLSQLQQAIVLSGPQDAKTAAMLRHVIGANPNVAKRLAAIEDPVKFAFAAAELVTKMKTNRKAAPTPERRLSSGAVGTSAVDNALEEARKRADKTGDRTEVARIMRQRQQRAA
jgi:hypothetical protein